MTKKAAASDGYAAEVCQWPGVRLRAVVTLVSVFAGWAATPVAAQLRPLVIQNARVANPGSPILESTCIKIAGGKIEAVRPTIKTGFLTKKIDATGKTVTPGFIDCWSTLGVLPGGTGSPEATARVMDAFDRYARRATMDALAHGVTAVLVTPPATNGVAGMAAVLRLTPWGAPDDRTLVEEAALCAAIGVVGDQGPLSRVRAAMDLRKKLRAAKDYRESLEDYEEDLKEYEKKLKERQEKEAAESEKEEANNQDKDVEAEPSGSKSEGDQPDSGDKDDDEKKEKDEITKPTEPQRSPESEMLLRVLDGEVILHVEAHRPEDILNVLGVAAEFSIKIRLLGVSGGHLVAKQIAEADVPVIVGPTVRTARFENTAYRYHAPDNAAKLAAAGVDLYVSSGGEAAATRFLGFNAALAVGHGLDRQRALYGMTTGAAKLLGIGNRIGRVARGMEADLVIWDGDPLSPEARVDKVLIGGTVVYDAAKDWPFGGS